MSSEKKPPARTDRLFFIVMLIYCAVVLVSWGLARADFLDLVERTLADGLWVPPGAVEAEADSYDYYRNVMLVPGVIGLGVASIRLQRQKKRR